MSLRKCLDCGQDKALEDFPPAKKRTDGRGSYCRPCMRVRSRESYRRRRAAEGREVLQPRVVPEGYAYCPDCALMRLLSEFPRNAADGQGRQSYCRPCFAARTRASDERHHGSTRDKHLMRRYGLTSRDVDRMSEGQGGVCAVCRERPPEHVDHDHVTGRVRGVLCSCCNQGLGNFRDRVDLLHRAIDYLETTTWQSPMKGPPVCTGVYRLTSPRRAARPSPSSSGLQRLISSRRG